MPRNQSQKKSWAVLFEELVGEINTEFKTKDKKVA